MVPPIAYGHGKPTVITVMIFYAPFIAFYSIDLT